MGSSILPYRLTKKGSATIFPHHILDFNSVTSVIPCHLTLLPVLFHLFCSQMVKPVERYGNNGQYRKKKENGNRSQKSIPTSTELA